ncbi:conserved exported hypothetical protein [Cupriavidus necator]|uniref:Uncharacterized protein n=1 Tax=Cupriavidus necator TaxID=106590 RepID=A0A1K0IMI2_CUPNE|nr:conserved exported hypothetical protein [Cupriavidus necator]
MQVSQTKRTTSTAGRLASAPAAGAAQAVTPMERLMDLLQEVRQFSRQLQRCARESAPHTDQRSYTAALRALLDSRMRCGDARMRIVCYASAAELGLPVELEAEHCRQAMSGGLGFPLRVLFWTAHRRVQGARRGPGAWSQPQR